MMIRSRVARLERAFARDAGNGPETPIWDPEAEARLAAHPEGAALEAELAGILERLEREHGPPCAVRGRHAWYRVESAGGATKVHQSGLFLLDPRAREIVCRMESIRAAEDPR